MTTPGMPLAVVRLYQPKIAAGLGTSRDRKPQVRTCGDEENRTLNPRLAKAVLCQLSYVPWRPDRQAGPSHEQQNYRAGPGYPPAVEGFPVASSHSAASAAAACAAALHQEHGGAGDGQQ